MTQPRSIHTTWNRRWNNDSDKHHHNHHHHRKQRHPMRLNRCCMFQMIVFLTACLVVWNGTSQFLIRDDHQVPSDKLSIDYPRSKDDNILFQNEKITTAISTTTTTKIQRTLPSTSGTIQQQNPSPPSTHSSTNNNNNNNNTTRSLITTTGSPTLSICVLTKDDTDLLPEWLAYHIHTMRLTQLIIAIDPTSVTTPKPILERFYKQIPTFQYELWTDYDYMPTWFVVDDDEKATKHNTDTETDNFNSNDTTRRKLTTFTTKNIKMYHVLYQKNGLQIYPNHNFTLDKVIYPKINCNLII